MNSYSAPDDPASPYVGNRPFNTADREIFFGRDREAGEVAGLWKRHRLTVLHGSAGVGKTSLLRAGVVPLLSGDAVDMLPPGHMANRAVFPMAAMPEQNLFTFALLSSWYPSESPTRISGLSVLDFLRKHGRTDRFGAPLPTLAAIDQAELLFRDSDPHERHRRRFLDELVDAVIGQPHLHLLLVVREDHLDEVLTLTERLGEDWCATYMLGSLDRSAALDAARGPLDGTGHSFDTETAELIVDELRTIRTPRGYAGRTTSTVDPSLLQLVCARLWMDLPAETNVQAGELTLAVDQALAEFCAQALATVAADHRMATSAVRTWFRGAFAERPPGDGVAAGPQTPAIPDAVLRAVEDRHLIRGRLQAGTRCYELQHPRLIRIIDQLGDSPGPIRRPGPPARLRAAELALAEGDFDLARRHVEGAMRACVTGDLAVLAEAECLLGNIAHEGNHADKATSHYLSAAKIFEALQNTTAVGQLLAAVGRLKLDTMAAGAVQELRAAVDRLPNDRTVQTALAQALWHAGQTQAALAVLNDVLSRDGDAPDALRMRGEILADLGEAESALRDLRRVDRAAWPSAQAAWALALAMRGPGESDRQELDDAQINAADSGPVLLRVARTRWLFGNAEDAAALAVRAVAATHPPLPPQLHHEARSLMKGP
ncbi:MAG TPA: tetratricopeptide repeat protein [Streptosporangiaceae bacterium]|nr:tetratricopeptide repeat protein [Streptosporangiaceae bacterium]